MIAVSTTSSSLTKFLPHGKNARALRCESVTTRTSARIDRRTTIMQNKLVVQNQTGLAHFEAVAAKAQELTLLKFVKGKYYIGDDEVPLGREYIAHVNQLNHGWAKFVDGRVTDQRIGSVAEGFQPPTREQLGDTDESKWEKDATGNPRSPWTFQYYLALEDVESGVLVTFVTGSAGGTAAIGRLCGQYARNASNGLPIIRLGASSYKHKSYGRVEVPNLPVISWTMEVTPALTAARNDMDDEVAF